METVQKILLVITIIGAINWGLIGIMNFDLVASIFGSATFFTKMIYTIVGICGIINIGILMAHLDYKRD